jgi:hypothetical protein
LKVNIIQKSVKLQTNQLKDGVQPARNIMHQIQSFSVQQYTDIKDKGKAIPLQPWTGPQGSRRLRLPDF